MKALVFHRPKKVQVENVPDPVIKEKDDILLKVTSTAICGSDLHIYNGLFPQPKDLILGHEFMGIVEEVASGVTRLKKGDRVVVPFPPKVFLSIAKHPILLIMGQKEAFLNKREEVCLDILIYMEDIVADKQNMSEFRAPILALEKLKEISQTRRFFF
jgi:hypothetical protein